MEDPGCKVYFVATCNNIKGMPPEYLRAGRYDTAPFFIDLPNDGERKEILDYYKKFYSVDGDLTAKDIDGWSGSEIKAICKITRMMQNQTGDNITLNDTRDFIVPISATMEEEISDLRRWAMNGKAWGKNSRCIPANTVVKIDDSSERSMEL